MKKWHQCLRELPFLFAFGLFLSPIPVLDSSTQMYRLFAPKAI